MNASPFQAIEIAVAATIAAAASSPAALAVTATRAIVTVIANPTYRSGRTLERITSDQRPTPIRSAAAATCETARAAAAAPVEKPRSSCR